MTMSLNDIKNLLRTKKNKHGGSGWSTVCRYPKPQYCFKLKYSTVTTSAKCETEGTRTLTFAKYNRNYLDEQMTSPRSSVLHLYNDCYKSKYLLERDYLKAL
jgi:hypothetical protein